MNRTVVGLRRALDAGEVSSQSLVESMLDRARHPDGEGMRVFLRLYADEALAQAKAFDACRAAGMLPAQIAR